MRVVPCYQRSTSCVPPLVFSMDVPCDAHGTQPPCVTALACLVWDTQIYPVFRKPACVTQAPL